MSSIISWFEIPARDFDRSTVFYHKVFGFDIEENEFNGILHGMISLPHQTANTINGVIVEIQNLPDPPSGPVLFFDAQGRMELILERIPKYGGEIIQGKTLIRNTRSDGTKVIPKNMIDGRMGYHAYFKDSEGNRMGLYSNS